jgi:phage-related protein
MEVVNNTFTTVSTVITTVLDVILQAVKLVLQLITGDFEGAGKTLQSIVETIWRGVKKVFETQLDSIKKIVGAFDLAAAGRAIIDSLRKGIEGKWEGLKSWFKDKLEGLRNMLPFSEPKDPASPLRNLSAAGRGITEQIQKGLNDLDSGFLRPVATAATAGGGAVAIQVTQNFYGPADEVLVRRAAQQGLAEALRQRGIS